MERRDKPEKTTRPVAAPVVQDSAARVDDGALAETMAPVVEDSALAETLPPEPVDSALAETMAPPSTSVLQAGRATPPEAGQNTGEAVARTLPASSPPPLGPKAHMTLDDTLLPPGAARGDSPLAILLGVPDSAMGAGSDGLAATEATLAAKDGGVGSRGSIGVAASGSAPESEVIERLMAYEQRYEEKDELGRGGLGRVYLAHDRQLGREVAIKELHRSLSSPKGPGRPDSTFSSRNPLEVRFLDEARVTAQLEHPGIPPVYELGQREDGSIYYAMRRIRGRTLSAAIRGQTLEKRLELMPHYLELCHAVAFAHSRGVIHRDLKTENVMLGDFGETLVLDWGLAKVRGRADRQLEKLADGIEQLRDSDAMQTMAGQALGTPSYMPPEQARGELSAIDERSDVYSLGAILYEILTGRPPHKGATAREVLSAVTDKDVTPPQALVPEVPSELAAVASRALARDPSARYPSARELAEDVRRFQVGGLVRAHQYTAWALTKRWVRRHRTALVTLAALLLVSSGAWWYRGWSVERTRQAAESRRLEDVEKSVMRMIAEVAKGPKEKNWLELYTFKLISMREPRVERLLTRALDHGEERVRRVAARALGGMKSRLAVPALIARLGEKVESSETVGVDVVNALGIIGDPRADRPVDQARWRHGQHGSFWKQTALAYQMIPAPPLSSRPTYDEIVDRGRSLTNKGLGKEAIALFDRAEKRDPRRTRALVNRAVVWQQLGDLKAALEDLDRALALDPKEHKARHNRALIYRQLRRYKEALDDLDLVVQSDAIPVVAHRNRSRVHAAMGNLALAEQDIGKALALDPSHISSRVSLASLQLDQGRPKEAESELDRALSQQPRYLPALSLRSLLRRFRGDLSGALADAESILAVDPDFSHGFRHRALIRSQRGDLAGARSDLEEALRRAPDSAEILVERAMWLHLAQGDHTAAEADLTSAVAIARKSGAGYASYFELYRIHVLLRLGRLEEARAALSSMEAPTRRSAKAALAFLRGEATISDLETGLSPGSFKQHYRRYYQGLRAELQGDKAAALAAYLQVPEVWYVAVHATTLAKISAAALSGNRAASPGPTPPAPRPAPRPAP